MTAEPQAFYDAIRHARERDQINGIGEDALTVIAWAFGPGLTPLEMRQHLLSLSDEKFSQL